MPQQLHIVFPDGMFDKIKQQNILLEIVKLQQTIEHQKRVIAGYKAAETFRKRNNK